MSADALLSVADLVDIHTILIYFRFPKAPLIIARMSEPELMTDLDIHAFGIEIVHNQLKEAGWIIETADVLADRLTHPQIVGMRDAELGFFVVRTAMYPDRGRLEGEETFRTLV